MGIHTNLSGLHTGMVITAPDSWFGVPNRLGGLDGRDTYLHFPALPPEEGKARLREQFPDLEDLGGKALVVLEEPRSVYHSDGMFNSGGYGVITIKAGVLRDDGTWEDGDLQVAFSEAWMRASPTVSLQDEGGDAVRLKRTLRFG